MRTTTPPATGTPKKKEKSQVTIIRRQDGKADVILPLKLSRQIHAAAKQRGVSANEMFEQAILNGLADQMPTVPIYSSTHARLLDAAKIHGMCPTRLAVYALTYVLNGLESEKLVLSPVTA